LSDPTPPVFFLSFDQGYLVPAAAAVYSLLKNHPGQRLKIYLLLGETQPDWINPLLRMIQNSGSEAILKTLDESLFKNLKLNLHFSQATYYRIMAAELFEEPKIIYLDSDTLVHGDLMEIWNLDLENYPLAAVQDPIVKDFDRLQLSSDQGYFNSGFMLLNLDLWRQINLGPRVLEYVQKFPEHIQFADQCGLNAVLKGNWQRLTPQWNVQTAFFEKDSVAIAKQIFGENELQKAKSNPKVIHFTGNIKPWNLGSSHPFKHLFWKYLGESPFKRNLPLNFSLTNLLKSFFPLPVKKYYWRYLKRKESQVAVY
jgi:lipopolysaccharide biosynthesis glycosyltransferase